LNEEKRHSIVDDWAPTKIWPSPKFGMNVLKKKNLLILYFFLARLLAYLFIIIMSFSFMIHTSVIISFNLSIFVTHLQNLKKNKLLKIYIETKLKNKTLLFIFTHSFLKPNSKNKPSKQSILQKLIITPTKKDRLSKNR